MLRFGGFAAATFAPTSVISARTIYGYAYKTAKKVMPGISDTEKAALEAGTVGFDKALFSGDPAAYDIATKYKVPTLTAEEQSFLDNEVEEACKMIQDYSVIKNGDLPKEVWDYFRSEGFFGLVIDKKWGGRGMSEHAHALVVQKIASRSPAAGSTVAVPSSLGPGALLKRFGTPEQQAYYLPRLAAGVDIPCFALTAPASGSDATSMRDTGVVTMKDGKLGMMANFSKRYITLAPVASVIGLAIDVKDPEGLLAQHPGASEGITVALLPRSHPGLEIGARHDPLGVSFMNGTVEGEDVFIPLDMVLGGPERTGFGWNMLVMQLSTGRGVSLPAMSTAASKLAANAVGAYARIRKQFKVPIADLEGVQEPLALIASEAYKLTASQAFFNAMLDQHHEEPSVLSAIMKQQATSRMREVVTAGMDILGGAGIVMGPSNFMGSAHMATPIGVTVEGANGLTRNLVIFGQGLIKSHPHMLDIMRSIEHGNDQEGFKDALNAMVSHAVTNAFGSLTSAVTRSRSRSNLEDHYDSQLARLSRNFALMSDMSLALGGKLKFAEFISGRMADTFSSLYLAHAVLWYHKQKKVEGSETLLAHAMDELLHDAQEAMFGVFDNFPIRPVGWAMRALTFPTGKCYSKPGDKSVAAAAALITHDTPIRDQLSEHVFVSDDLSDRVGLLNHALAKAVEADNILRDARRSKRSLTEAEQAIVDEAEEYREEIIQVDAFKNFGPGDTRPALNPIEALDKRALEYSHQ